MFTLLVCAVQTEISIWWITVWHYKALLCDASDPKRKKCLSRVVSCLPVKVISIPSALMYMVWRICIPNEPRHEKTCLCHMGTIQTQISLCILAVWSACAAAQSDQRLCYSLPGYYNTCSFHSRNFKPLASFCGCASRFESYLVGNPIDRFSHDEAQIWRLAVMVWEYSTSSIDTMVNIDGCAEERTGTFSYIMLKWAR